MDSDAVVMSGSDADSSADGKVMAKSVDSEEGVVEVTMKDSPEILPSIEGNETTSNNGQE
jgi:ubiquitin carboxyl-terminal hydrolase 4/11/15